MEDYIATLFAGIIALLFLALGAPLAMNKVRPNTVYGYRVSRYVFEDEDLWYKINGRGGRHMVTAGIVFVIYAGFSAFFIGNEGAQVVLNLALLALVVIFLAYELTWSVRLARRTAREKVLIED
ncbi:MAG: SdpI family protein [Actinomycetota bacterium]|nr:SdpI family protein [Actinomycetota bacterium]